MQNFLFSTNICFEYWNKAWYLAGARGQEKLDKLAEKLGKQVEKLYQLDQGQGSSGAQLPFIDVIYCARYLPRLLCSKLGCMTIAARVLKNMDFTTIFTSVKWVEPISLKGMLRLNKMIYLEHQAQSQARGVFVNIIFLPHPLPQSDAATTY